MGKRDIMETYLRDLRLGAAAYIREAMQLHLPVRAARQRRTAAEAKQLHERGLDLVLRLELADAREVVTHEAHEKHALYIQIAPVDYIGDWQTLGPADDPEVWQTVRAEATHCAESADLRAPAGDDMVLAVRMVWMTPKAFAALPVHEGW